MRVSIHFGPTIAGSRRTSWRSIWNDALSEPMTIAARAWIVWGAAREDVGDLLAAAQMP